MSVTIYASCAGNIASRATVYANARSGSLFTVASGNGPIAGQMLSAGTYYCYEGYASFDTTQCAYVSGASLVVRASTNQSASDFMLNAYAFDWGDTLAAGDWVSGSALGAQTLLATYDTAGGWTGDVSLTPSGSALRNAIVQGGITRILFASQRMADNTTPVGQERVFVDYEGEATGNPALDPYLILESTEVIPTPISPLAPESLGEVAGGGGGGAAGDLGGAFAANLFSADLVNPKLLEQFLTERMVNKKFTTRLPGGFGEFSGTLLCDRHTAMSWLLNYQLCRLVISNGGNVAWEGRIEDMEWTGDGLNIIALGFWSSLWDQIFYDPTTYTTGSYDIKDVVQDILEAECPSIAADYSHLDTTGVDVVPAVFDRREYAGDAVQSLLELGDTDRWYAAVWDERKFWLFRKSKQHVHWRMFWDEVEQGSIAWSVEGLRNRVRVAYTTTGASATTDWQADSDSYAKWGIYREEWPDAGDVGLTAACAMRDKRLDAGRYMQSVGRLTVRDMIRNGQGVWVPAWRVRAGHTLHIPDLTPGFTALATAEDPRRLYILETEYDWESGTLTIIPESPERRI